MLLLVFALAAAPAPADATQAEAERLFADGRAALKDGDVMRACEAFAKSHQLQPALGVLLNLAACLEKQGKLGSAWLRFNEAVAWAQRTHEGDREKFAREHAASVKPRVSWLSVSASGDVQVIVDAAPPLALSAASPVSVPADLGAHRVEVRAPGFEPWSATLRVEREGASASLTVPPLKATPSEPLAQGTAPRPDPGPPPPPPPLVTVQAAPPNHAGLALLLAGGAVAVAGGVGLAWSASTYDTLQGQRATMPDPQVRVSREAFDQLRWIYPTSWVLVGVGAAAAVTGIVLTARASSGPVVMPVVQPGGVGLAVSGTF